MRIAVLCAAAVAVSGMSVAPAVAHVPAAQVQAAQCKAPQLIAHRGGGGVGKNPYYYENSWVAFKKSAELGVKVIETDVRWTRDNVPVIMHDDDLARTTNGTGLVSESTIDYIKTLDLDNGGGKIPMFDEVLTWAQQNNLQIWPEYKPETPNQPWIDDYAARIRASGANTVVPSFLKPELAQFKTLLPGYSQIWFHDPLSYKPALVADVPAGAWAGIINVFSNATVYDAMAKAGIPVYTWFNIITGGDNATGWDAMAKLKPVGIITDYPAEYQKWEATTTFCLKVQKAKCAKLPKKLPGGATTVILTRTCTTNAGKKVTVKVSGKATLQKGKKGRVSVVTGSSGKAQVSLQAKAKKGYKAFSKAKKYKLT